MERINNHPTRGIFFKAYLILTGFNQEKPETTFKNRENTYLISFNICITCLLFVSSFQSLEAQEIICSCDWIIPVGHETSSDGHLLLKDNTTQAINKFAADCPDMKTIISGDRKTIVLFGHNSKTHIYRLNGNSCTLLTTIPAKTEYATFSHSGEQLFLLHTKSWLGLHLTSYETRTWLPVASRKVSSKATAISINSSDSLIGISSGSLIQTLDASNLKIVKMYWEEQKQMLLEFSPIDPMIVASVTPESVIQIRDLHQDFILAEIKAHNSPITSLQFNPTGELVFSHDDANNLFAWDIANRTHVLEMTNVEGNLIFEESGSIIGKVGNELFTKDISDLANKTQIDSSYTSSYLLIRDPESFVFFPQPVIDWRPETEIQFGASSSFFFFPKSLRSYPPEFMPSSIIPKITYAPDGKQIFTSIESEIYTLNGWNFNNRMEYNIRARNYYFGIGNQARRDNRVPYTNNWFSLRGDIIKHLNREWKVGFGYAIRHDSPLKFEENKAISEKGISGGWLIGGGPVLQIDFRDDFIFPTKGSFLDTRFYVYHNTFGSSFQYREALFDYRKYIPIPVGNIPKVLAFQAFSHLTFGQNAPFYQLPHMSFDRMLRGVWRNLYIDSQMAFLQTEFRSYFSPGDTRFGYVLFLGAGDVADSFLKDWQPDIKLVYGVGYRQQLIPKLRLDLRIDMSISNEGDFGIFGGVGVAF